MSRVPDGWQKKKIASLFRQVRRNNTAGCAHVLTISGQYGLIDQREFFNRSVAGANVDRYYLLKRGEFAYNRSAMNGYPCGAIKRLEKYDEGVLSTLYTCFAVKDSAAIPDFYKYVFESEQFFKELRSVVQVGARAHGLLNITPAEFMDIPVASPPLPEQKKIAAILSSVDEAIAATQAVIEQTRKVKQGLLQDLLTRGIGHTRFKHTEIGEIPEAWEVKRLEDVVSKSRSITYGIVQTGEYIAGGVPCVRVVDMVKRQVQLSEMITTTDEISQNYRRTILKEGDIIFALRGEIGHVRFVSSTLAGCNLTRGVALISPPPIVYSRYLLWALRSPAVRREIILQVNGSALKEIPLSGLRKVLLPVPPTTEQKRLAALLDSTQFSEKINMDKVEFLQSVKRGLMQNLLSGSVRVTTP